MVPNGDFDGKCSVSDQDTKPSDEIVAEAKAISRAIEDGSERLSTVALRARRLAQSIGDEFNYLWLRFECQGGDVLEQPPGVNDEVFLRAFEQALRDPRDGRHSGSRGCRSDRQGSTGQRA